MAYHTTWVQREIPYVKGIEKERNNLRVMRVTEKEIEREREREMVRKGDGGEERCARV
jgi:hypothetical protein